MFNINIPRDATTGMFTVGPPGAPVSVSGVAPVPTLGVAPPVAPVASPVAPPMLGNTDYTIRQTPASALSMLGGLPVAIDPRVAAYLSSQPQIVSPFQGMPSLAGAQDIFGGRSYVTHSTAGPEKRRVGLMEMKQLNQTEGYNTTVRPEFLGETYLPFRPEGNDPNVVNDTKLWHQYYTDNKDYRKYLSADEQTELAWLDYRTGLTDKNQFTSAVNEVRENFNLPKKVSFEDFEAHFSIGTKRKKYSDNPYQDLQDYGPSIGGYWNPENDPSETQQVLSNPFVQGALTAIGSALGGPVGAALASTATTRAAGADWSDALTAGAVAGITGAGSQGLQALGLNPATATALARGASTLAQGGSVQDALVSGGLAYLGSPGGMLSKTLGDLGLDVGQSVVSQAVEDISLADLARLGYKSKDGFGDALASLIENMDLGTLEQTGLLGVLPESLQEAVRKVQLSDVLAAGAGGLSGDLAMNILNDVNLPFDVRMGMLSGNISIPDWIKLPGVNVPQWLKDAYEEVESVAQQGQRAVEGVVQPVAEQVERALSQGYDVTEQAIQDAISVITPRNPGPVEIPGLPDVNMPNVNTPNLPNINTPNLPDVTTPDLPDVNIASLNTPNLPNFNMPNFNLGFSPLETQGGMFDEFDPYRFGGIKFKPRTPLIPVIQPRGQDPLSILLRG